MRTRFFLALILSLIVAVTSVTFAQARHMAAGAQTMVICTGYGLVQITLDTNGDPVERSVPCPDCVAPVLSLGPDGAQAPCVSARVQAAVLTWGVPMRAALSAGHWHAPRAPPLFHV